MTIPESLRAEAKNLAEEYIESNRIEFFGAPQRDIEAAKSHFVSGYSQGYQRGRKDALDKFRDAERSMEFPFIESEKE